MADIKPFDGYFYNPNKIKSLSQVIAPPYDVIPLEEREEYYAREHNIINLILPKETENQDKYAHSASLLNEWLKNEIFVKDDKTSFYLYRQDFLANGEDFSRKGFFALVQLEDFQDGKILPHENTLSSPKEDRFKLLNATRTNLSPIFLIYSDENNEVMKLLEKNREASAFADFAPLERKNAKYIQKGFPHPLGKKHTLWRVSDSQINEKIKERMKSKTLYIADGHHRYETALKFWKENKKDSYRWILAYISPIEDDSLKIFPAHRLLKTFSKDEWEKLNDKAKDFFWIKEMPIADINETFKLIEAEGDKRHAFGVVHNSNGRVKTLLLVSKNEKKLLGKMDGRRCSKALATERHSPAWKHLDVSVLHSLVFSYMLGLDEKKLQDTCRLDYAVDRYKTLELVKRGDYQIAFLLNSTKVDEVRLVANRKERMPGKATYFYPKVSSGFFINVFGK
jgi:uncharacterized protein (DUF1015 family)